MSHTPTKVRVDTYTHRWECSCGWQSTVCANELATAGAEMVRHMIAHNENGKGD